MANRVYVKLAIFYAIVSRPSLQFSRVLSDKRKREKNRGLSNGTETQ